MNVVPVLGRLSLQSTPTPTVSRRFKTGKIRFKSEGKFDFETLDNHQDTCVNRATLGILFMHPSYNPVLKDRHDWIRFKVEGKEFTVRTPSCSIPLFEARIATPSSTASALLQYSFHRLAWLGLAWHCILRIATHHNATQRRKQEVDKGGS